MNKEACFYLGKITKARGLQGEVSFKLDVDFPEAYKELESVFVEINGQLVPFFIEEIRVKNNGMASVRLADVDSKDKTTTLVGNDLYLPLEILPELEGNRFYFHEIIGFEVIDKEKGFIGNVEDVMDYQQPIIVVKQNSAEILIPVSESIIKKVDRENMELHIQSPEGLIELYTQ